MDALCNERIGRLMSVLGAIRDKRATVTSHVNRKMLMTIIGVNVKSLARSNSGTSLSTSLGVRVHSSGGAAERKCISLQAYHISRPLRLFSVNSSIGGSATLKKLWNVSFRPRRCTASDNRLSNRHVFRGMRWRVMRPLDGHLLLCDV